MFGRNCSSSLTENNKIGFEIFGFFCDLIWILQDPAKTLKRGKNHFAKRALERLGFTPRSSVCTKHPGITWSLSM
jgi:hypothetical protein